MEGIAGVLIGVCWALNALAVIGGFAADKPRGVWFTVSILCALGAISAGFVGFLGTRTAYLRVFAGVGIVGAGAILFLGWLAVGLS